MEGLRLEDTIKKAGEKYRSFLHEEAENNTNWRHGGPPIYDAVNKLFEEGRTKVWEKGSLEETVQNAIKSWEMELSHKTRIQDFKTINPEKFKLIVNGVIELYGPTFLRRPTWSDLQHIYDIHDQVHGFPGMIGSIDCMYWAWELCPSAYRGTHTQGDVGRPLLILQAVASNDLWIWNAYFGQQDSHNDINMFESSPILEEIISGLAPRASFYANSNNAYDAGYYLTDGIYPEYATFVKTFTDPDQGKAFCQNYDNSNPSLEPTYWEQQTTMEVRIANSNAVRSRETHNMLTADLVDHLWENRMPGEVEYVSDDIDTYVSDED